MGMKHEIKDMNMIDEHHGNNYMKHVHDMRHRTKARNMNIIRHKQDVNMKLET